MAILRQASPESPPSGVIDWQNAVAQLELAHKSGKDLYPAIESGGSWYVPRGYCFYHRGTIYAADEDTLISGTKSNYIKMTASVDGATCDAEFLADLSGVTWDDAWAGYFDASDNLVVVDEFDDANVGTLEPHSEIGEMGRKLLNGISSLVVSNGVTALDGFSNPPAVISGFRSIVVPYPGSGNGFTKSFFGTANYTGTNFLLSSSAGGALFAYFDMSDVFVDPSETLIVNLLSSESFNFSERYVFTQDDDDIFGKTTASSWDHTLLSESGTFGSTRTLDSYEVNANGLDASETFYEYEFSCLGIGATKWLVLGARTTNINRFFNCLTIRTENGDVKKIKVLSNKGTGLGGNTSLDVYNALFREP